MGLEILRYLIDTYPDDISGVVVTGENDLYKLAKQADLPVHLYSTPEALKVWAPEGLDVGVLAWWPFILREPLLSLTHHGFINTHPSLLPHNRGKHYNFWAIVEQAPFGVTLHWVDAGVDTGGILAQRQIAYDWTDNGGTLYRKAQAAMLSLFFETYPRLRVGHTPSNAQSLSAGSFHHSSELEKASRIDLDANYTARQLLNLLRARTFDGHPACWFIEEGQKYEVIVRIQKVAS